ncbi:MAG: hypothetical protein H7Z37_03595 [Pyrinomonadaceae bacterium]|nr:hypothetical protein [Pyrinomonadaceae bacterium]
MTVTIQLKPETEKLLTEKASQEGLDIETFLQSFIENYLQTEVSQEVKREKPFHETATKEEWLAEFHKWVDSHGDKDYPSIPDEALRRENMYEDRF